jgi:serine/threonine protein kinase
VAQFRIERLLGEGGMGVVYAATQIGLARQVALKVLSGALSEDPEFKQRFQREGELQASIKHPNIVTVYEAGESEVGLFLAMEFILGQSLREIIPSAGLPAERALWLLQPIASALDIAHSAGLIHRDVKPDNILVGEHDHPYLADFGLIKTLEQPALTGTGQLLGTLHYMAPEQLQARGESRASDVYALTAVLYESLTGDKPFPRDNEGAIIYSHVSDDPPLVTDRRPDLPDAIDAVVRHGMAKDPTARPASAGALIREAAGALPPPVARESPSIPAPPTAPAPRGLGGRRSGPPAAGSTAPAPEQLTPADPSSGRQPPQRDAWRSSQAGDERRSSGTFGYLLLAAVAVVLIAATAAFLAGRANAPSDTPTETTTVTEPGEARARPPERDTPAVSKRDSSKPVVRRTTVGGNPLTLSENYSADLDTRDPAWDVALFAASTPSARYDIGVPIYEALDNNTKSDLAVVSGPRSFGTCRSATGYSGSVEGLRAGKKVCVKTSERRLAFITIKKVEVGPQIVFDVTVWDPPVK